MPDVRFHFIGADQGANGNTEEARLAAAILANCLSRQGYRSRSEANTVHAAIDMAPESGPHTIWLLLNEEALERLVLDDQSAVVVCSARPACILQQRLGCPTAGLTAVDASGIAMEAGSDEVLALLGGAARTVSFIETDALCAAIWSAYDRQLPYAARAALKAFDQGYMQAQQAPPQFA